MAASEATIGARMCWPVSASPVLMDMSRVVRSGKYDGKRSNGACHEPASMAATRDARRRAPLRETACEAASVTARGSQYRLLVGWP